MIGAIFYDDRQSVLGFDSFSPSAGKPARFMALMESVVPTAPKLPVMPITREDLYLVHDKSYVDAVFEGTTVNGFENRDPRIPPACLWTVGSLVSSALHAPSCVIPVCSPTSGFHHANYGWGGGYCTFNGLMVAAAKFLEVKPDARIAILDCDFHYGDGTADILKRKPQLASHMVHHTSGLHFHEDGDPDEFFQWLEACIQDINDQGCDLTLYQAGADMHVRDPLGGLLDTDQMTLRDRAVFSKIRGGLVWNLAGGYRGNADIFDDPTLLIHRRTMQEANQSHAMRVKFFE